MDSPKGLQNINVTLCDRPYRLKVKPDEEENVRRAAKAINAKVKQLQGEYAAKDKQDYLAMTALMLQVESLTARTGKQFGVEDPGLPERIDELERRLDEVLST